MTYLDFDLEITPRPGGYTAAARSPAGEARQAVHFDLAAPNVASFLASGRLFADAPAKDTSALKLATSSSILMDSNYP